MCAYDLDHLPDRSPLPEAPTKLLHIAQLVIVVEDRFGPNLIVQLHSYAPHGHLEDLGEGHWVPPYVSFPIEGGDPPPMTVGQARSILDAAEDPERMATEARLCAWRLGFGSLQVKHMGSLTQLKRSFRVPQQWMVFRFHRYAVKVDRDFGLRNLADPEALRGLVHLPLDGLKDIVVHRERDGRVEWWFRGKPLSSDLKSLVTGEDAPMLGDDPIKLGESDFHRTEEGLILFTDLAGWGTAMRSAARLGGIGVDNTREFFARTTEAQYRFLSRIGPSFYQDTGDGVVAVFHGRVFDLAAAAERLLLAARDWLRTLESQINAYLPPGAAVGSRFALHVGVYEYGRIGQALSHSTAVRGQHIVEASRLELALAGFVKAQAALAGDTADGWRHTLAVSETALPYCEAAMKRSCRFLIPVGSHVLTAKESTLSAHVWRFDLRES